jgi:hypothetical protein
MKHVIRVCTVFVMLVLSGCGRIIDWGVDTFYQGTELPAVELPPNMLQSVVVYNQLSTRGMFDALYLSDEVRTKYATLYAQKHNLDTAQANAFLRRQLEENTHFIAWYILVGQRFSITGEQPDWNISLRVGDRTYTPMEMRQVDLPLEYIELFGDVLNRFKIPHLVKFDAQDINEQPIITPDVDKITLVFRSIEQETIMTWPIVPATITPIGS